MTLLFIEAILIGFSCEFVLASWAVWNTFLGVLRGAIDETKPKKGPWG